MPIEYLGLQLTEISPELADAADVLSDQLRVHLHRLAEFLLPHAETLDRRFLAKLKAREFEPRLFEPKIRTALASLTPGAAARILASGQPPLKFIEQVEYNGRRLAKLNLPPSSIVEALQEYDRLLTPLLRKLLPNEYANFQWVREQLHFCVILTLNNAYYQVREAETQAFYELFRVELESRNLDELLRRFLETLVQVCHADAGHLYLLNDKRSAWVLRAKAESGAPNVLTVVEVPNRPAKLRMLAKSRQISPWQRYPPCASGAQLETTVSDVLVHSAGGRRPYRGRDAVRFLETLRMAAPRAGAPGRGCRALSDGGREGSPDGGSRGSRRAGPATGRAHAPRRGDRASPH